MALAVGREKKRLLRNNSSQIIITYGGSVQDISDILNRLGEVGLMGLSLGWIRIV